MYIERKIVKKNPGCTKNALANPPLLVASRLTWMPRPSAHMFQGLGCGIGKLNKIPPLSSPPDQFIVFFFFSQLQ
jgi:hypothetical protein